MELETINNLYLELSQVATANTQKECNLVKRLNDARALAYELQLQIERSGASPELTECSVIAQKLSTLLNLPCW